jgi:hypothetical protein
MFEIEKKKRGEPKRVKRVGERNMGVMFKINTYSVTGEMKNALHIQMTKNEKAK